MDYRNGARVRVKGKRGELVIIGPLTVGPYADRGYWAWSASRGAMVPIHADDIKEGASK